MNQQKGNLEFLKLLKILLNLRNKHMYMCMHSQKNLPLKKTIMIHVNECTCIVLQTTI